MVSGIDVPQFDAKKGYDTSKAETEWFCLWIDGQGQDHRTGVLTCKTARTQRLLVKFILFQTQNYPSFEPSTTGSKFERSHHLVSLERWDSV